MPNIGDVGISAAGDYANGYYYVEEYGYYSPNRSPAWYAPAWEERGWSELAGPFTTEAAATAALIEARKNGFTK